MRKGSTRLFFGIIGLLGIVAVLLIPVTAGAGEVQKVGAGDVEAGLVLGEPTGFSVKVWTGLNSALDAGVAWSFGRGGHIHLHADYLVHNFSFFNVESGDMPLYFGIGGRIRLENDETRAGMRIPIGAEYIFEDSPVGIFIEIVPIMDVIPETTADLNAGFGIRYIF